MAAPLTRRRRYTALAAAAVLALCVVLAIVFGSSGDDPVAPPVGKPGRRLVQPQSFVSRPDLRPPTLTIDTPPRGTTPGDVLLSPKGGKSGWGPMIVDPQGALVWFKPMRKGIVADDLAVQRYHGQRVLTWWEGRTSPKGYGAGSYVIADSSYREIARVRAGRGFRGDLHEFQLTPQGTALLVAYHAQPADLSAVGGPRRGRVMDSIVQEVDVATGKVRFTWHALDHVALRESHMSPPKRTDHTSPYDYFHVNAVDVDADGNLLVSARNTWALYKLDRSTGRILWRLGGKRSDFRLARGVRFAWQHDVRRQPDGTISIFDNEAAPPVRKVTRLLRLRVDQRARRVTVARAVVHPKRVLSAAEGNAQWLPDGGVFAGYGLGRHVSEFAPDGTLRLDIRLPGDVDTYRAYREPWIGSPARRPALRVRGGRAYMSWNGATGVDAWQLVSGGQVVAGASRSGFETSVAVPEGVTRVSARAIGAGRTLSTSRSVAAG